MYIHDYIHTQHIYLYTRLRAYIYVYIPAYMHINTYKHAHIHACSYARVHAYIYLRTHACPQRAACYHICMHANTKWTDMKRHPFTQIELICVIYIYTRMRTCMSTCALPLCVCLPMPHAPCEPVKSPADYGLANVSVSLLPEVNWATSGKEEFLHILFIY